VLRPSPSRLLRVPFGPRLPLHGKHSAWWVLLTLLGGCLVDDGLHDARLRGILGARHAEPDGLLDTGAPTVDSVSDDPLPDPPLDQDGDGVTADLDCDDGDPSVWPEAPEVWADHGVDNDCDGDAWDPLTQVLSAEDALTTGEGLGRAMARWEDCVVVLAGAEDDISVVALSVGDMGELGAAGQSTDARFTALDHLSLDGAGRLLMVEESMSGAGAALLSSVVPLCDGQDVELASNSTGRISAGVPGVLLSAGSRWVDDLDGDGRDDLAVVVSSPDGSNGLAVFLDPPVSGDLSAVSDADRVVAAPGLSGVHASPGESGDGRASLVLTLDPGWADGVAVQLLEPGLPSPNGLEPSTVGVVVGRAGKAVSAAVVHGWTEDGGPAIIARQGASGAWPQAELVGVAVLEDAPWPLPPEDPDADMVNVGDMDLDGRDDLVFGLGVRGVVHPVSGAAVVLGRTESVEAAGGDDLPGFGRSVVAAPVGHGGVLVGAPDGDGAVVSLGWPGVR
jgi:hypothetical protein